MRTPKCLCARCKLYMRAVNSESPEYDIFEEDGLTRKAAKLTAREYQTALIEIAKNQNIIACLPTGSGKTFIALKLIEHFQNDIIDNGKKVIFLANTIPLVGQQAEFFARHSMLRVKHFTGDMEVDYWSNEKWGGMIDGFQVLAMTTQIFLNIIRPAFIKFSQVALIIFDECHHAVKDHPMKHVMLKYQETKRMDPNYTLPRILGMTATIVKGNCTQWEVPDRIVELEKTMQAKAVTYKNYEAVLKHSTSSQIKKYNINSSSNSNWEIFYSLETLEQFAKDLNKLRKERKKLKAVTSIIGIDATLRSTDNIYLGLQKPTPGDLRIAVDDVKHSCVNLGPYCGIISINLKLAFIEFSLMDLTDGVMKEWYENVRVLLNQIKETLESVMNGYSEEDKVVGFTSTKLRQLVDIISDQFRKSETDSALCPYDEDSGICGLVFVDRRVTAQVLAWYLRDLAKLNTKYEFIRANFVVGTSRCAFETVESRVYAKKQTETIEGFRKKKYNLLVATSVLEEGIDVPSCNLIVRFDKILSYTSYIQSMGRARKPNALFCALIGDKNYIKDSSDLDDYQRINTAMVKYLIQNVEKIDEEVGPMEMEHCVEPFCPGGTADSPSVSLESAMDVVDLYCNLLPCDGIATLQTISWWTQISLSQFQGHLKLPMNSKIRGAIVGEIMCNRGLARQAVHFAAAKQLYELGVLDEKLIPVRPSIPDKINAFFKGLTSTAIPDEEEGEIVEKPKSNAIASTNEVNTEWYRKKIPRIFQTESIPANLHLRYKAYRISFHLSESDRNPKYLWKNLYNFGQNENCFAIVTTADIPDVGSFPLYGGFGVITASLKIISNFKYPLYLSRSMGDSFQEYIFGDVLGLSNRLIRQKKEIQLQILPIQYHRKTLSWAVDEEFMNDVVSFSGAQRLRTPNEAVRANRNRRRPSREDYKNKFENSVVVPWYKKGQKLFYFVETVDFKMNPSTPFHDGNFSNYRDFIQKEYKTRVYEHEQPLLLTKLGGIGQGNKQLNYLLEKYAKEDEFPVYLLPELVHKMPISATSVIQLKLIPSFLHRLYQLLLAHEILTDLSTNWSGILSNEAINTDDLNRLTSEQEETSEAIKKRRMEFENRLRKQQKPIRERINIENRELHYEFIHPNKITKKDIQLFHEAVSDQHAAKKLLAQIDQSMQADGENSESKIELTSLQEIHLQKLETVRNFENQGGPSLLSIMEALTLYKSNAGSSNARLHKIGWSFLNYVVSTQTFFNNPDWSEPLMCQLRNRILSIQFLCVIGKRKNMGELLSSSDFYPTGTWLPPGFELAHSQVDIGEIAAKHKIPLMVYDALELGEIRRMTAEELDNYVMVNAPTLITKRPAFGVEVTKTKLFAKTRPEKKQQPKTSGIYSSYTHTAVSDVEVAGGLCSLVGAFFMKCGTGGALKLLEWLEFPFPDLDGEGHIITSVKSIKVPLETSRLTSDDEEIERLLPFADNLEQIIQYKFVNRKLLLESLTHPTFLANNVTECYQRLEFLGDAILDALLTSHIFRMTVKKDSVDQKYTTLELSEIRSALVNNITYASLAVRYGLHKHLHSMSKALVDMIDNFVVYQQASEHHVVGHYTLLSDEEVFGPKHMEVPKVLGDIFEALAGAIYIDSGESLDTVWKVFYRLMENEIDGFCKVIPKSPLQELYTGFPGGVTFRKWTSKKVRDRGRELMKITVGPHGSYFGAGTNKTRARDAAAKIALKMIKEEDLFIQDRDASRIMMLC